MFIRVKALFLEDLLTFTTCGETESIDVPF